MATSLIPAGVLPAVKSKCAEVVAAFPKITHVYGFAPWPDHNNRRCIDFMVYNSEKPASANLSRAEQVKLGDAVVAYLLANRDRLGVNGIIWNRRVIDGDSDNSAYRGPEGVWRTYSGDDPHTDHVHAEFNSSAYVPPVAPLRPLAGTVWLDRLVPGVTDSDSVRLVQRALGIPETGVYDLATVAAVKAQQQAWGDAPQFCDGVLGPRQTELLFAGTSFRVEIRSDPSGQAPAPVPPATPPSPPKEALVQFTAGYGNVLRETDTMAGRLRWPARRANVVQHLKSTDASVLMLCEVDKSTAAYIAGGLGQAWSYYPCGFATGKEFSPLAILWDSRLWRREVDAFVREYSDDENRFLMRLPLVHVASGKAVTFYASHLENDGDPQTDGHVARRTEARQWASWTVDGPGIWGADLNSTTRSGAKATARQREKPRPILRAAGWRFLTDQSGVANRELASHHGGKSSTPRGPWIDDMGFKGLTYVDGALIRTDADDASDHHFLSLTVRL